MKDVFNMETICDEYEDRALAGTGCNTVRKYTGRYLGMRPGDRVYMEYKSAVGAQSFAEEHLVVSSVAVADLSTLFYDHGVANQESGLYLKEDFIKLFEKIYGDVEGQFMAIYFQ